MKVRILSSGHGQTLCLLGCGPGAGTGFTLQFVRALGGSWAGTRDLGVKAGTIWPALPSCKQPLPHPAQLRGGKAGQQPLGCHVRERELLLRLCTQSAPASALGVGLASTALSPQDLFSAGRRGLPAHTEKRHPLLLRTGHHECSASLIFQTGT